MATKGKPMSKNGKGASPRDAMKFRLAARYVKGKRLAQKRQPSKGHRSYLQDDD